MASPEPVPVASGEAALWATSGAMWLTGPAAGPPRTAPGSPAGYALRALEHVRHAATVRTGHPPALPGVEVLGERAALGNLRRRWPWSCGGAFRFVPTGDGFLGISLPRAGDLHLVRALVRDASVEPANLWTAVAAWARQRSTAGAVEQGLTLGLACAPGPGSAPASRRAPVVTTRGSLRRAARRSRPLVVDLTALWAGPLCANLLGLTGADVVKVESVQRPDGARVGAPALFELLHSGHRTTIVDFRDPADVARLRNLMGSADLVLEASRPRALAQLGLIAEELVDTGTSWLSITARGRASNTVGFGDDVAAEGGMSGWFDGSPVVCGDAIGDPLSGLAAAAAACDALLDERARLIDVSMVDVCRAAAAGVPEDHHVVHEHGRWWVCTGTGRFPVRRPRVRPASRTAGGR